MKTINNQESATPAKEKVVYHPPSTTTTRYVNHAQATKLGGWSPSFLTWARKNGSTAFKTGYIEARLLEDLTRGMKWNEKALALDFVFKGDEEAWGPCTEEQHRFYPDIFFTDDAVYA